MINFAHTVILSQLLTNLTFPKFFLNFLFLHQYIIKIRFKDLICQILHHCFLTLFLNIIQDLNYNRGLYEPS